MPVKVAKRGSIFRIVEQSDGKVSLTKNGKPRDGGGHKTIQDAFKQAAAINRGKEDKDSKEQKKRRMTQKEAILKRG